MLTFLGKILDSMPNEVEMNSIDACVVWSCCTVLHIMVSSNLIIDAKVTIVIPFLNIIYIYIYIYSCLQK